jgi:hypothetical protein
MTGIFLYHYVVLGCTLLDLCYVMEVVILKAPGPAADLCTDFRTLVH